jgi:hypothetical protein
MWIFNDWAILLATGEETMKKRISLKDSLTLMTVLAAVMLWCGPVSAQGRPRLSALVVSPPPPAYAGAGSKQAERTARDKAALDAALEQYLDESEAALTARMAGLRSFFEERKAGTRRFAQAVLGMRGKFEAAATIASDLANQPLPFSLCLHVSFAAGALTCLASGMCNDGGMRIGRLAG